MNLSLAFNHALGGLNVGGYHAFNLIVHLLAGLALFGVVRLNPDDTAARDLLARARREAGLSP